MFCLQNNILIISFPYVKTSCGHLKDNSAMPHLSRVCLETNLCKRMHIQCQLTQKASEKDVSVMPGNIIMQCNNPFCYCSVLHCYDWGGWFLCLKALQTSHLLNFHQRGVISYWPICTLPTTHLRRQTQHLLNLEPRFQEKTTRVSLQTPLLPLSEPGVNCSGLTCFQPT